MNEQITIQPLGEEHIRAAAEIERLCFASPWSENAIREELHNEHAVFFAAMLGGVPVGYAGMFYILDEGNIANVAVHPDFRRRGAARLLLGALKDFALKNAVRRIWLEVRLSNGEAIRLYDNAGFVRMGMRPNFYEKPREDALLMMLDLSKTRETEVLN